jgi:hypothetical protein
MSSNILQISFLVELKQFLNHGKEVWLHQLNPLCIMEFLCMYIRCSIFTIFVPWILCI